MANETEVSQSRVRLKRDTPTHILSPLTRYKPSGTSSTGSSTLNIRSDEPDRIMFVVWSKPLSSPCKTRKRSECVSACREHTGSENSRQHCCLTDKCRYCATTHDNDSSILSDNEDLFWGVKTALACALWLSHALQRALSTYPVRLDIANNQR